MDQKNGYYLYILSKIIPEISNGLLKICPCDERDIIFQKIDRLSKGERGFTLSYAKGVRSKKRIAFPDNISCNVKAVDTLDYLPKNMKGLISKSRIVASFASSQQPAILFHPESASMLCFFDLEELVCRIATLKDESGKVDLHGRFLGSFHEDKSRWKAPLLEVLGKLIRSAFGFQTTKRNFGVLMTHDVDWISVEPIRFIRNLVQKRRFETIVFNDDNDCLYQNLKGLIEWDYEKGIPSTWYFLSGSYSLRRYGNRYSSNSRKLKRLIPNVMNHGHSVGLHTSYYGGFDLRKCQSQKEGLEKIIGHEVAYNRNHYLRFDIKKSISLYETCGFKADSTMGYSDANGFRAGLCRPFYPWNYDSKGISNVVEIPLLFMDSVHSDSLSESWNDLKRILLWMKEMKGCGSFLFHPSNIASDQQNKEFYFQAIKECQRMNIPFLAIDDILNECQS